MFRVAGGVFSYPAFALYWTARVATSAAMQMQVVAVGWQVYALTADPLDLGLVGLAQFLPSVALALVTGYVADRFDRRWILVGCFMIELGCLGGLLLLTLGGNLGTMPIFLLVALYGAARSFEAPAASSLMPNLVPPALLRRAVALNSSGNQAAQIAAPAVGGLLYAGTGAAGVYGVCAVLLAVSIVLLVVMRINLAERRGAISWAALIAGVTFIRNQPTVLGAISLDLFAVLFGGAVALLPIFAADILVVGPLGLGLLRAAPAVGALLTALYLAQRPIERQAGRAMFGAVAVFGLATIGFGLSQSLVLSLACLAVLGASDMVSVVIRSTLVQLATPDEMRGRVSAVNSIFIGTSNQLGEFESGVTAALFGTVPAVVIGGLATLGVTLLGMRWFPELRRLDALDQVQPGAR